MTVLLGGDSDAELVATPALVARHTSAHRPAGTGLAVCDLGSISIIEAGQVA